MKIIIISLIPILFIGSFLGGLLFIIQDLTSFIYELDTDPEIDDFYALNDIDLESLRDAATLLSEREEDYHIPINLSQVIKINESTNRVAEYRPTDNAGLFTGYALSAECFRYANLTMTTPIEKEQSLTLVKKLLSGLIKLIEVPNGGLGPEYPGQTLARFYAAPEWKTDGNFSWMFEDHHKHYNGTGKYSDWRVRLYTSKDELGGYILGIASAFKLVDDPWVQENVKLIVGQLTEGFLDSYWQEIHGDGTPCGAHLQPPTPPQWKLVIMKMAILMYPNNERYKQLYHYYLTRCMSTLNAATLGATDSISNYFGLPFEHNVILSLLLVEDNQKLIDRYITNYEKSYRAFKGQRNAYFNSIYLAMNKRRSTTAQYNITKIRWDVLDQLWRLNVSGHIPFDDTYGGDNVTITREELATTDESWVALEPKLQKWKQHPLSSLYNWLWEGDGALMPKLFEDRYIRPATADMFGVHNFIWGKSPFTTTGGSEKSSENFRTEAPGVSFSLPYWIIAYFGYL
ncbi:MAG: hypothetical protein GF364_19890 [Candidatus Lokiarchaeota archaeon]|nr:hypothetical protein [Candidatus Lokiarchaeota archaeon]